MRLRAHAVMFAMCQGGAYGQALRLWLLKLAAFRIAVL